MSTLKGNQEDIKEHYSFIYNDGLALYDFTLETISDVDGIAEFSVKALDMGVAEFITTVQRFDVEDEDWAEVGDIRVHSESVGDTDAIIERCRHIFGVPNART